MGYFPTHYVTIIWFRPLLWSEFKRRFRVWLLQTSPMNFMKSIDKSESDWIWLILKCMYTYILPPASLVQYFKFFLRFLFSFSMGCILHVSCLPGLCNHVWFAPLITVWDLRLTCLVNSNFSLALISCLLDYIGRFSCSYIAQFFLYIMAV